MKKNSAIIFSIVILLVFLSVFLMLYNYKFENQDNVEINISYMENINNNYSSKVSNVK